MNQRFSMVRAGLNHVLGHAMTRSHGMTIFAFWLAFSCSFTAKSDFKDKL